MNGPNLRAKPKFIRLYTMLNISPALARGLLDSCGTLLPTRAIPSSAMLKGSRHGPRAVRFGEEIRRLFAVAPRRTLTHPTNY